MAGALRALGSDKGPVTFRIAHAAGTLDCDGRLARRYDGKGDCRFTGDPGFERQLAARGLTPDGPRDLLAMLMVDATVALADGLTEAGLRPRDSDDLIAAAALERSEEHTSELQSLMRISYAVFCL